MSELVICDLWMELDEANSLNIIFDRDDEHSRQEDLIIGLVMGQI